MPKPIIFLTVSIGLSVWIVILMIPWLWVGPQMLFRKLKLKRLKQEIKNDRWNSIN